VVRRCVARFPASFLEPVRDSPSVTVERARLDAPQAHQGPQPQGAPQGECQPVPLVVLYWVPLSADLRMLEDGSA
jgi:hypothetical protein